MQLPLQSRPLKSKQDISNALHFIEASRDRGCDKLEELLTYEINSISYFLVPETKEGHILKKCDKSELSREVLVKASSVLIEANSQTTIDVAIIGFMALLRKVPVKKMGLKTYGDLALALNDFIKKWAYNSRRIDLIFDVYTKYSPKSCEIATRGATSSAITVSIKSDGQNLPVNFELFWSSIDNKMALQKYFIKRRHYFWRLRRRPLFQS